MCVRHLIDREKREREKNTMGAFISSRVGEQEHFLPILLL
jgi:hypothetical protein